MPPPMLKRVTVIREGSQVYVDNDMIDVDCSELPDYFHALQWYPDAQPEPYGEIEYAPDGLGRKLPNTKIYDFDGYTFLVDRHAVKKAARVTEAQARAEAAAAALAAAGKPE